MSDRLNLGCALVCAAILFSACATGDSGDDPSGSVATPPPTLVPPISGAPAGTQPESPSTSTTSLVPSAAADLPTGAPGADPVASIPTGPLPTPRVMLASIDEFSAPVGIAIRPLDERMFVVEQGGVVRAVDDLSDDIVLDISSTVSSGGEQGLLGLAFHPDLELAYVNYTDRDGRTIVAEYQVDPVTAVFDPESARAVLAIDQPFSNHNGGDLTFGPDGLLYISTGDGGSADDPQRSALDLTSLLGKILRIDPIEVAGEPYQVPADNPFAGDGSARPEIWSYGLRNPWRFSFDEATGDLWIADVGQGRWEEVNYAPATEGRQAGRGVNFGWSAFEALERFNEDQPADGATPPVYAYPHEDGACSVSGGTVARGGPVDSLDGWYVAGDYCSGRLFAIDTTTVADPDGPTVVDVGELAALSAVDAGPDGTLYAVSNAGTIAQFIPG